MKTGWRLGAIRFLTTGGLWEGTTPNPKELPGGECKIQPFVIVLNDVDICGEGAKVTGFPLYGYDALSFLFFLAARIGAFAPENEFVPLSNPGVGN